jgi:amino acid adenylation domain-containing protein
VTEHDAGMTGELEYSTDLFDRDTITSLADRVVHTLTQLTTDASAPLSRMSLTTAGEQARLHELSLGPVTETTADLDGLRQWGDRIAVLSEGWAVTYTQLEELRDRLAAVLLARGVGRGSRVGVCLGRSPWLVVAILALWQVGAAYVPMDPAYPAERRRLSAQDAGLTLIVTDAPSESAAVTAGAGVIHIDRDLAEAATGLVRTRTCGRDAAYVIFTSGSTGRPKGVTIPRQAIGNLLSAMRAVTGFGEQDVLLAVTTPVFDIAALELLMPLTCGGRVVLAPPTVAGDGTLLAETLDRHQVTFMQATPATWKLLAQTGWAGRRDLTVICGGEELPRSLASWLRRRAKRLWNVYGPTETTVWSTASEVAEGEGPVPLGTPLANTRIHVVDAWLRQTPVGVPGELLIGGLGVADGYAGQPGLTASRFVPDPFGPAGGRLYRTGDIVRFRRDGSLEFLGRRDQQVKLRGFRIELGEIEARLRLAAGVHDAVVIVRDEGGDDLRLTGYVIADGPVAPAGLQAELRRFLPPYMVPSAVMVLDEFPLTPNGKVDRRALPAPSGPAAEPPAQDKATDSELNDILTAVEALASSPPGLAATQPGPRRTQREGNA